MSKTVAPALELGAMQLEFESVRTKAELEALIAKVFGRRVEVEFVMPKDEPEELAERMVQFAEFINAEKERID